MVYHLVFETAPEAFNEGIVAAVAWAAHGRDQPMLGEKLPVCGAGELAAAIRVEDEFGARCRSHLSPKLDLDDARRGFGDGWERSVHRADCRSCARDIWSVAGRRAAPPA